MYLGQIIESRSYEILIKYKITKPVSDDTVHNTVSIGTSQSHPAPQLVNIQCAPCVLVIANKSSFSLIAYHIGFKS